MNHCGAGALFADAGDVSDASAGAAESWPVGQGAGRVDPDAELLRQFAAGNARALEELAARHEAGLLGVCKGLLRGRRDLAQEAVQDVWLKVIRSAVSFRGESTVKTWLYTIAINHCRSMMRRAEMRHGHVSAEGEHAPVLAAAAGDAARNAAPISEPLARAIAALTGEQQELVSLCYHASLSHSEVAQVLGVPVGTVKSRLNAALTRLRGLLATSELAMRGQGGGS